MAKKRIKKHIKRLPQKARGKKQQKGPSRGKKQQSGGLHVAKVFVGRALHNRPVVIPVLVPSQYVKTLTDEPILDVQIVGPLLKAWQHVKDFFREMQ